MYTPTPLRFDDVASLAQMAEQGLDLEPGPGGSHMSAFIPTIDLFYPRLQMWYPTHWLQATVISLQPSAQLVAHKDPPIRGIRHHLPLALNEGCWVFHDGVWQQLEVGQDYTMDPSLLHGAVNWGATRRLHLIIDVA